MKVNELRVGNWIHLSSNTDGIETDLQCCLFHLRELDSVKYVYTPIPLTEEWLVKFGFHVPSIKSRPYGKLGVIEVGSLPAGDWYYDDGLSVICSNTKYVHQLQNLYFALTGFELETKETI